MIEKSTKCVGLHCWVWLLKHQSRKMSLISRHTPLQKILRVKIFASFPQCSVTHEATRRSFSRQIFFGLNWRLSKEYWVSRPLFILCSRSAASQEIIKLYWVSPLQTDPATVIRRHMHPVIYQLAALRTITGFLSTSLFLLLNIVFSLMAREIKWKVLNLFVNINIL